MIIDIHTHTFPDQIASRALAGMQAKCHTALFSDGTAEGLLHCEARAGVDLAVVQPVATYAEQVPRINDHLLESGLGQACTGLRTFGAMHPGYSRWEAELERLAEGHIAGIKLHPPYSGIPIDDPRSIAILRKCRDLHLIVLIHSGWDVGLPNHPEALPIRIRHALDAVGPVRLIAGHMGGWACWEEAAKLLAETGIWFDTAFSLGCMKPAPDDYSWSAENLRLLNGSAFCDLIHTFGAERILFGTDSPWADPAEELKKIRSLPLTQEEVSAICGENARKLLQLRKVSP